MMEVLAVSIHEIDGYFIHIFKRTGHDNKYVKIVKSSVTGKYILIGKKEGWEKGCSLDAANKRKITEWVAANKVFILEKIKELNDA
jgi:hypothetical protein